METGIISSWPKVSPTGHIVGNPAHLVFVIDESMIGDRIEVWGQVEYTHGGTGERSMWYPNVESMTMLLSHPQFKRLSVRIGIRE